MKWKVTYFYSGKNYRCVCVCVNARRRKRKYFFLVKRIIYLQEFLKPRSGKYNL